MDIGEMKQRIEFMVEENVSDGQGGYDTTLVSKGSTWAKVHWSTYFGHKISKIRCQKIK